VTRPQRARAASSSRASSCSPPERPASRGSPCSRR
jgi:hypothetical protein